MKRTVAVILPLLVLSAASFAQDLPKPNPNPVVAAEEAPAADNLCLPRSAGVVSFDFTPRSGRGVDFDVVGATRSRPPCFKLIAELRR